MKWCGLESLTSYSGRHNYLHVSGDLTWLSEAGKEKPRTIGRGAGAISVEKQVIGRVINPRPWAPFSWGIVQHTAALDMARRMQSHYNCL